MTKRNKAQATLADEQAAQRLDKVRAHGVQALQAHRVADLWLAAAVRGHRVLHADLTNLRADDDLERQLARALALPEPAARRKGGHLLEQLTLALGPAPEHKGFLVILENLPADLPGEQRESVLDAFWAAADFWEPRQVPFRCFYSAAAPRQSEGARGCLGLQVSEQALRFASPFSMAS